MKLYVEADFDCDSQTLFEAFVGPEFERRLAAETGITRRVLEVQQEGDVQVERVECVSSRELPALVARALGTSRLSYEQHNRSDPTRGVIEWSVHLPVLRDKVRIAGVTTVAPHGSGARRTIDGDVEIRVPLVGSRIEKQVLQEFEKSYKAASAIARDLLASRAQAQ